MRELDQAPHALEELSKLRLCIERSGTPFFVERENELSVRKLYLDSFYYVTKLKWGVQPWAADAGELAQ
jgi:hypothetical protein